MNCYKTKTQMKLSRSLEKSGVHNLTSEFNSLLIEFLMDDAESLNFS